MILELTPEQRARIELLSLYFDLSPTEVLIEAAESLVDREAGISSRPHPAVTQRFLSEPDLETRLARILRH